MGSRIILSITPSLNPCELVVPSHWLTIILELCLWAAWFNVLEQLQVTPKLSWPTCLTLALQGKPPAIFNYKIGGKFCFSQSLKSHGMQIWPSDKTEQQLVTCKWEPDKKESSWSLCCSRRRKQLVMKSGFTLSSLCRAANCSSLIHCLCSSSSTCLCLFKIKEMISWTVQIVCSIFCFNNSTQTEHILRYCITDFQLLFLNTYNLIFSNALFYVQVFYFINYSRWNS